jgi:hypothetical protein
MFKASEDAQTVVTTAFYFRSNSEEIQKLAADPSLRKPLMEAAREIAKNARAATPKKSGQTARSIMPLAARLRDMEDGNPEQQVAIVAAFDAIWHMIEFGSINNPPYRPLTTGAKEAFGDAFVEVPLGGGPPEAPGSEEAV